MPYTPSLRAIIDLRQAVDGSRYGSGPNTPAGGVNTRTGGRILFQFTVHPSDAATLAVAGSWGVTFDITRQKRRRTWRMDDGTESWTDRAPNIDNWPADDEDPTDDGKSTDEDNVPTTAGHIYSWDAPSIGLAADGAFTVRGYHFREWVRVRIGMAPFINANNTEEGSRCSSKHDWRFMNYFVRAPDGNWVHDPTSITASTPVRAGTGTGTMSVTLLAAADTEGYVATYAVASDEWTLVGTDGGNVTAGWVGGVWTLTNGTRATAVITPGATAFSNTDTFRFSVFQTTRSGGKVNFIEDGPTDPTDGP